MTMRAVQRTLAVALAVSLLLPLFPTLSNAGVRVRGSVGARVYTQEDAAKENHLWLLQDTRLSVYTGGKYSLHASGGYEGDQYDDFSNSGNGRLLKAYVQYGGLASDLNIRAGRFFLYRGVVLGTIDGTEAGYRINRNFKANLFVGMLGPYSRRFEFEDPDKAMSYGGSLSFAPTKCPAPWTEKGVFTLSYARQQREEGVTRHLIGLQTYQKYYSGITWLNNLHFRAGGGNLLRKWISRARWQNEQWRTMFEFGVLTPDVPEFSWFSSNLLSARSRVRTTIQRTLFDEWGAGIEGQMLMTGGGNGFRGGPVIFMPWGQIGYRMSGGDYALSSGPWVSLAYSPMHGLETYAYGAIVSYEWDQFDVESEDLTMVSVGARYTPAMLSDARIHLEYQLYQTPQFDRDPRFLMGLAWHFDTGGAK